MKFICSAVFLLLNAVVLAEGTATEVPWIEIQGKRFFVEIADNNLSRFSGLMFRQDLADDRGMLFIYPRDSVLRFWMKNTLIPLDIIFLDSQFRVVNMVMDARPCKEDPCVRYSSQLPASYVVEVNAGIAASLELESGDTIRFSQNVENMASERSVP